MYIPQITYLYVLCGKMHKHSAVQGLKCKECKFRCHVQCEPQVRLKIMMVIERKMKMMTVMTMMMKKMVILTGMIDRND